jgi:NADH-quinone oxidoreductase subunit J
MPDFLFYLFSALAVLGAFAVVVNKNPVNGALCLLISLFGLAGLFILLDAALLAFVLVMVYAGAVVALFLFIIMLLDTRPGHLRPYRPLSVAAASIGGLLLVLGAWSLAKRVMLPTSPATGLAPTLKDYAASLFTTYLLPVQVVGFLLLIAMLGVIVLSRKFADPEGGA